MRGRSRAQVEAYRDRLRLMGLLLMARPMTAEELWRVLSFRVGSRPPCIGTVYQRIRDLHVVGFTVSSAPRKRRVRGKTGLVEQVYSVKKSKNDKGKNPFTK